MILPILEQNSRLDTREEGASLVGTLLSYVYYLRSVVMLLTTGVAAYTVANVADSLLTVLRDHPGLGVASVAGVGLVLLWRRVCVTRGARDLAFASVVEREGVFERRTLPATRRVATGAGGAKLAKVFLWLGMARDARGGCALVDVVGVALATDRLGVGTSERERRLAVVERCHLAPAAGCVATGAVGTKGSLMFVIFLVARNTRGRCALVDVVGVATGADRLGMASDEREGGLVMVEYNLAPAAGRVATGTVGAEGSLVFIVFLVTGDTRGGCALVDVVDVATGADRRRMDTGEREGGLAVVKGDLFPVAGDVATSAVGAECSLVFIILLVTSDTTGGRALIDVVGVAACADRLGVSTREREGGLAVVKSDLRPRARGVAACTVGAKGTLMHIILLMTGDTRGGRTFVNVIAVATGTNRFGVGTGEWEGGLAMVEGRDLFPVAGDVATGTVGAKLAEVFLRLGVASHARGRRAFVDVVSVAVGTDYLDVSAGEGKFRLAMVE